MTQVTDKDLNGVAALSGSGSISNDYALLGKGLKGRLAAYNYKIIRKSKEMIFLRTKINQVYEYQTERYKYSDLPKGLDKYKIENKVIKDGSCLIIKLGDTYYACNYVAIQWDIYNWPTQVKILEPRSSVLNGKEVSTNDPNVWLIRNNAKFISVFPFIFRLVDQMEKTLFQLEKNLLASAPKGIINPKNGTLSTIQDNEGAIEEAMEDIAKSENTFFFLNSQENYEMSRENGEQIFIPLQLEDRTDTLIKQYLFLKEELKEMIGGIPNMIKKAERVQNGELQGQDSFAASSRQHGFNVREVDIKAINEKFNINIKLEYQSDNREDEEEQLPPSKEEGE